MSSYFESLFSLKGKTALCSGATRGIGATMAQALAKAGASVILAQRDESNTATRDSIIAAGGQAEIVICDLSDPSSVRSLVKRITAPESGSGRIIDILVNCGGIQRRAPAAHFTDEDWSDVLQVNLDAVFTLARDVGRHMIEERANTQPTSRGKIVNIASLLSYQGGLTVPAYAAAKHGVLGLTKSFSNEWASKGINVNAIAPGYIETEMNTALIGDPNRSRQILERIPLQRWGSPDDFEGLIIFLCSSASDYLSGECIACDGGWMGR